MLHCEQQVCIEISRRRAGELLAAAEQQSPAVCLANRAAIRANKANTKTTTIDDNNKVK